MRTDRLLLGRSGIVAVWSVAVGGQLVWVAYGQDSLSLADALAIEGVIVAVVFGILALRIALRHEVELRTVSGTIGGVSSRLEGVSGTIGGVSERLEGVSGTIGGVSKRLQGVSDSVLTRTVGVFPRFVPHLALLLSRAERRVTVLCDNPAYGIFSNGPGFDTYVAELQSKISMRTRNRSFAVDLMFLAADEREVLHRDQAHMLADSPTKWEEWRSSPNTQAQLREFLERANAVRHPDGPPLPKDELDRTLETLTMDDYVQWLAATNAAMLDHNFFGAHRRVLKFRESDGEPMPRSRGPSIYFWMRDDVEAIFAIVPLGDKQGETREVGFETHDPAMIDALRGVFSRYLGASSPYPNEQPDGA